MEKELSNCHPVIVNKTDLATEDIQFLDVKSIKERCKCINKEVCLNIAELLSRGEKELAEKKMEYVDAHIMFFWK